MRTDPVATTEQTGVSAADSRRFTVHDGVAGGLASVEQLVERASALQVRAPELALILGERAAAAAESAGANELWVRAESLVVHTRVRLGHRASTVGRAVTALRAAEDAGHPVIAAQLRTDLAVCARAVGAPLTGLAALRPVLTVGGLSSVQRAAALCHLVGCLGTFGRKAELDRVLLEGDHLIARDTQLGDDDRLAARALLRVGVSAHRRRHGDLVGAADAARTGIGFLDDLGDADADGGLARVRLVLELVCSLLDRGDADLALEVAEPLLATPARAGGIAPSAWLRLAIATRVHLVNGSAETAARMLRDAVHSTGRHGLYALTARLWLELAHVEERIGQASEAIQCLYRARSAEHLHTRVSSQARALLTGAFGTGEQAPVDLAGMVVAAGQAASAQPPTQRTSSDSESRGKAGTSSQRSSAGSSGGKRRADERDASSRPRVVLPMLRLASGRGEAAQPSQSSQPPTPGGENADSTTGSAASAASSSSPRTPAASQTPASASSPASTSEPPEPRTSTDEVSATEITAVTPIITDDTPPPEPRRRRRKPEPEDSTEKTSEQPVWDISKPPFTTPKRRRHDTEHGSVAARSVLDRLGISPGKSGGRRRAADRDDQDERVGSSGTGSSASGVNETPLAGQAAEASVTSGAGATAAGKPPADEPTAASGENSTARTTSTVSSTGSATGLTGTDTPTTTETSPKTESEDSATTEDYGWLPRLKLPPALAPLNEESVSTATGQAEQDSGAGQAAQNTTAEHAEQFSDAGSSYDPGGSHGAPTDDPPPDAGLAELLARALAEHQAGTASAAALVRKLGVDDEQPRINGKHRGDG